MYLKEIQLNTKIGHLAYSLSLYNKI